MTKERHALGRAVAQDGVVLDILVQRRQHQQAAKKFFRTLLKGCQYAPRVVIPDKRKSDGASKRAMLPGMQHRQHRSLITMPSTPTSQHDSGNGTCRGASLQASPNGFSPHMGLSPTTSDRAVIAGPRPQTVKKCAKDPVETRTDASATLPSPSFRAKALQGFRLPRI